MGKRALVLAGGGAKGAYEMGVWKALRELSYSIEIVTGTSVGALNGALVAQGEFEQAEEAWKRIRPEDVLERDVMPDLTSVDAAVKSMAGLLRELEKGGVDYAPLKKLLATMVDEEKVRASDVDFGLVTVELPGFKPVTVTKAEIPQGRLHDYLLASAACFPAMKSYRIGDKAYIDGGYYDNLPVNLAIEMGAEEVVAVDLEAVGRKKKKKFEGVNVHYLRSGWDLGGMLVFDAEQAQRNITLGYLETLRHFGRYEGYRYCVEKGSVGLLPAWCGKLAALLSSRLSQENTGALAQTARLRVARALQKKTGMEHTPEATLLASAEYAAERMGLSPYQPYRALELMECARDYYRASQKEKEAMLDVPLDPDMGFSEKMETVWGLLKNMDRGTLAARICSLICEYPEKQANGCLLVLLAAVFPTEFIAAAFLWISVEKESEGPETAL